MNKQNIESLTSLSELIKEVNYTCIEKAEIEEFLWLYDLLHELRITKQKLGLTQDELSKRSNISRSEISKIFNGKRNVTITNLSRLANALGKQLQIKLL